MCAKGKRILTSLFVFCMMALVCACGETGTGEEEASDAAKEETMTITSDNLHNGVWDTEITNTAKGKNLSPELTWSPVDGASEYVVYMVDPDGHNWIHWILTGLTKTHIEEGEDLQDNQYVGPYPPSGTHRYIVTVYALAAKPDSYPGNFDAANKDPGIIAKGLDLAGGKNGNILASGSLEGTYTHGD